LIAAQGTGERSKGYSKGLPRGVLRCAILAGAERLELGAAQARGLRVTSRDVNGTKETAPNTRWRAVCNIVLYGVCAGALILALKLMEYRFLVIRHSIEIYVGLIGAFFAGLGIWLGQTLTRKKPETIIKEVPAEAAGPFVVDEARVNELEITARELEILGLIATGLSNREIAGRLFVSENTVKTHSNRLFEKLGAKRRTQAVQIGKSARLIP
jgi:NarL family two-component system response regulator LiaR